MIMSQYVQERNICNNKKKKKVGDLIDQWWPSSAHVFITLSALLFCDRTY